MSGGLTPAKSTQPPAAPGLHKLPWTSFLLVTMAIPVCPVRVPLVSGLNQKLLREDQIHHIGPMSSSTGDRRRPLLSRSCRSRRQ